MYAMHAMYAIYPEYPLPSWQRAAELPCADDITGVDETRTLAAAVAVFTAVITLLPCPGAGPMVL